MQRVSSRGYHAVRIVAWALAVATLPMAFTSPTWSQGNLPNATTPNNPAPVPDRGAAGIEREQAPIGHRQPRPQDLPPSVQREESQGSAPQGDITDRRIDQQLQICRGC